MTQLLAVLKVWWLILVDVGRCLSFWLMMVAWFAMLAVRDSMEGTIETHTVETLGNVRFEEVQCQTPVLFSGSG